MNNSGVYMIENTTDGQQYVGSTSNISSRWSAHRRRYDPAQYRYTILFRCDREILRAMEQRFIDLLRPKLNKHPRVGAAGYKHTPEVCAKRSSSLMGHTTSDETRAKISASLTGRKITDEAKARIYSPERNAKISVALSGRKHNPEHTAKMLVSRSGYKHTPEVRAKISASLKGNRRAKGKGKWQTADS